MCTLENRKLEKALEKVIEKAAQEGLFSVPRGNAKGDYVNTVGVSERLRTRVGSCSWYFASQLNEIISCWGFLLGWVYFEYLDSEFAYRGPGLLLVVWRIPLNLYLWFKLPFRALELYVWLPTAYPGYQDITGYPAAISNCTCPK